MKNSFEAMPDGGELIISTHLIEHADSEYAEITLRGTEHGIEADNPGDSFIPFYSPKKFGGNYWGLGLYMSYTLMQKNNGEFTVKNLDGEGYQFTILMPA